MTGWSCGDESRSERAGVQRAQQERLLQEVLVWGRWPSAEEAGGQELAPLVRAEVVRRLAPDEERLILFPPPFVNVQDEIDRGSDFWTTYGAVGEIDAVNSFVVADFGLGSDTAVVVELAPGRPERVLRLQWAARGNHWVLLADSLVAFRAAIEIEVTS